MKKKKGKKKKKELSVKTLLSRYRDPLKPGSLGGVTRFANKRTTSPSDELEKSFNAIWGIHFTDRDVVGFPLYLSWCTGSTNNGQPI